MDSNPFNDVTCCSKTTIKWINLTSTAVSTQ